MEPTKVVVKYANGTVAKGFTQNFSPNRDWFYLTPVDKSSGGTVQVFVKRLKAIFIVRDFIGNPKYDERKSYVEGESPPGVKLEVTFTDGEVMGQLRWVMIRNGRAILSSLRIPTATT